MSVSINVERYPAFVRRIANWWRNWTERQATLTALKCMGSDDVGRLAHDVGLTGADLKILAGRWPDSAELLSRRLAVLKFDENVLVRCEPKVMRDLQRVCSLCGDKPRCQHHLAVAPFDEAWRDYCPNAQTLEALDAERSARPRPKAK
jgi:uncharacterized protein YjiS (DUF1127 family)